MKEQREGAVGPRNGRVIAARLVECVVGLVRVRIEAIRHDDEVIDNPVLFSSVSCLHVTTARLMPFAALSLSFGVPQTGVLWRIPLLSGHRNSPQRCPFDFLRDHPRSSANCTAASISLFGCLDRFNVLSLSNSIGADVSGHGRRRHHDRRTTTSTRNAGPSFRWSSGPMWCSSAFPGRALLNSPGRGLLAAGQGRSPHLAGL